MREPAPPAPSAASALSGPLPAGVIVPEWPAPAHVRAFTTTRAGGASSGVWQGLNLGARSGDHAEAVACNRARLRAGLPAEPGWVQQVHGIQVAHLPGAAGSEADAVWTAQADVVCAILTADCLPVLLVDRAGTRVAAAHAGWRGLVDGVLEATMTALGVRPAELLAWLGPAIGPAAFEVGPEVRARFLAHDAAAAAAFQPGRGDRWHADLYQLARQRLQAAGVQAVYGGDLCTFSDPARFYSYRRDGVTGRMGSLIWLAGAV